MNQPIAVVRHVEALEGTCNLRETCNQETCMPQAAMTQPLCCVLVLPWLCRWLPQAGQWAQLPRHSAHIRPPHHARRCLSNSHHRGATQYAAGADQCQGPGTGRNCCRHGFEWAEMCTAAQQAASGEVCRHQGTLGTTRYLLHQYTHSKEAEFAYPFYALSSTMTWHGVIQPCT